MTTRTLVLAFALLLVVSVTANVWQAVDARKRVESEAELGAAESPKQLYTCGMHPNVIQEGPGICPICGMNLTPVKGTGASTTGERRILYWRAPMDPNYISDKPGKSPMGMDLVPVYEDKVHGEVITVDPSMVQSIGVRTAMVERRNLARKVETNGVVLIDESRTYRVNPKVSGWIERLYVNETGQFVDKGQPILEIYSPELVSAQEEYLLALRAHRALESSIRSQVGRSTEELLTAARDRLEYWDVQDSQIASLESSGEVSRSMTLYSPASGVVIHKDAVEGGYAKAGTDLFRIADLSRVWVEAQVYEYELPWVKVGQAVSVRLPYEPGKVFEGKVSYIYPYLDPTTRTATIRMALNNSNGELKPEMYANVAIQTRKREGVLAVPREAVLRSGKRDIVFLSLGDGRFLPREVELGLEADDNLYEIQSGLSEGNQIVVSAQFLLDSEVQLQEALKKLVASNGQARDMRADMKPDSHQHDKTGNPAEEHTMLLAQSENKERHTASGPTMEAIFTTDTLYQCPMHPEIITPDSDARCPLCNMPLEQMPSEELDILRHSHPYGCVMCPVVRPGEEKDKKCSVCGMFLKPFAENSDHSRM